MTHKNYSNIIESMCQSIDCHKPLSEYEINRQKLLPRSSRYRFCRSCRQIPNYCGNAVRWRCRLCPQIMSASDTHRGRLYCLPCGVLEGRRRSRSKVSRP